MIVSTSYKCAKYEVLYLGGKYYMVADCKKNVNEFVTDLREMSGNGTVAKLTSKFIIWISTND